MKTQKDRIIYKLKGEGYVTRNQALNNYISRLSSIIQKLEADGWVFKTSIVGNDYRYDVVKSPLKNIIYQLENGQTIEKIYG